MANDPAFQAVLALIPPPATVPAEHRAEVSSILDLMLSLARRLDAVMAPPPAPEAPKT